jgi:hypothetical protein
MAKAESAMALPCLFFISTRAMHRLIRKFTCFEIVTFPP